MATNTTNYNLIKPAYADTADIADLNGNMDIIDGQMKTNADGVSSLKGDIGIVEDGNTATHTISKGQYVVWKESLYTADSAIPSGTALSSSGGGKNLSAVSNGGLNGLNSKMTIKSKTVTGNTGGGGYISITMDNESEIIIGVCEYNTNSAVIIRSKSGANWNFNVARLQLINGEYLWKTVFNTDVTLTVYYLG